MGTKGVQELLFGELKLPRGSILTLHSHDNVWLQWTAQKEREVLYHKPIAIGGRYQNAPEDTKKRDVQTFISSYLSFWMCCLIVFFLNYTSFIVEDTSYCKKRKNVV